MTHGTKCQNRKYKQEDKHAKLAHVPGSKSQNLNTVESQLQTLSGN